MNAALFRVIVLVSVFLLPATAQAGKPYDYGVLVGEWGAFESKWFGGNWYQYLRVGDHFDGVFAYSYGNEPLTFWFSANDIKRDDGLTVITLRRKDQSPFRLVLSGWRLKSGSALVSGSLFMYQLQNDQEVLFNTIPVRFTSLENDQDLSAKPELQKLRKLLEK